MIGRILLWLIHLYRQFLSVVLKGGRPSCRFLPTCSEYAEESIRRHGAGKGSLRALGRILRCHPLGGSGYDPP